MEPAPTSPIVDESISAKKEPPSSKTASMKKKKIKPTIFVPMPEKTFRSLMGSLLFMTRSRPELIPICSFAGTKSKNPSYEDYEEITLKTILGYSQELLNKWKIEISRETYSLIETTGALEVVTPEWLEANKGKYDVIGHMGMGVLIASCLANCTS
jgi:hypothetical protein